MISGREREEGKKSMNFPKVLPTLLCEVSRWYRAQLHCWDTITHFWVHTRFVTLSRLAEGWIRIVLVSFYCHKHEMLFFCVEISWSWMKIIWNVYGEKWWQVVMMSNVGRALFWEEIEAPKNTVRVETNENKNAADKLELQKSTEKGRAQHEHCWELRKKRKKLRKISCGSSPWQRGENFHDFHIFSLVLQPKMFENELQQRLNLKS